MKALSDRGSVLACSALAAVGGWTILALITWSDPAQGPRFGSPWTTYGYGQAALTFTFLQLFPIVGTLTWQLVAGVLGYTLIVRPLWAQRGIASSPTLFFAGIVPGSLLAIALTRIVSLLLPNSLAPSIIVSMAGGVCAYCLWTLARLGAWTPDTMLPWRRIAWSIFAIACALVFSVHLDRGHVVGEGSVWFINRIFLSPEFGVGAAGYWPLVAQHYDEAAFLYPMVYGLLDPFSPDADATLTFMYWIMLAFGRISAVALLYVAVRGPGRPPYLSELCGRGTATSRMFLPRLGRSCKRLRMSEHGHFVAPHRSHETERGSTAHSFAQCPGFP